MIKYYTGDGQVYFETEGEKPMNKEQKVQEINQKIDKLKRELEELRKGTYEVSYPKDGEKVYFINPYSSSIQHWSFNNWNDGIKQLYKLGMLFDTKEEAEQFLKEQTLIKKIKCWAKEQQGDWQPNWNDGNETKHHISFKNNRLSIWHWYTNKLLTKLPCFKSQEIAQACMDEFGEEIIEVFC